MNEQGEKLPRATICVVLMLMTFAVSDAAVIRQPPDLGAGDRYRLVFLTSTKRDALSSDIAEYDAFVQATADAAPEVSTWGLEWKAIGSTAEVDARDHVHAHPGIDEWAAVYRIDGMRFADNYDDFWSGLSNIDPRKALRVNEFGWFEGVGTSEVWTGTFTWGVLSPDGDNGLGSTQPIFGRPGRIGASWYHESTEKARFEFPMYAISEVLVAVPEPASRSVVLFGLLSLAILGRRHGQGRQKFGFAATCCRPLPPDPIRHPEASGPRLPWVI